MLSDIEISKKANMLPIQTVASRVGISRDDIENYGNYKAKLSYDLINKVKNNKKGKLILVTAINPTPAGEGKTTVTIGLGQALSKMGKKCIITLREPSLGPVFGRKGGATGGGYSQVIPMDEINLHFTGDFHAITSANNLLAAMIDNHIFQGNKLEINPRTVTFKRALDVNDRSLRTIITAAGEKDGSRREDGFVITAASEVMAILCLASDLQDLKNRLGNILIGYTLGNAPIYARDINAAGAMTALLKDAFKPNLVQTLENTPCFIHGGPFANIAHGCNSIIATKTALGLSDYTITEAGFGADLGAEKFLDIKCRVGGLTPDAVVLVATIRALKYNGGLPLDELKNENLEALKEGFSNLERHIENIKKFDLPVVVTINRFDTDTANEVELLKEMCEKAGTKCTISDVFAKGGTGGTELANAILNITKNSLNKFKYIYDENDTISNKIDKVAKQIYRAKRVIYSVESEKQIQKIEEMHLDNLPICIAKTPSSFSDDEKLLGAPTNFDLHVREVKVCTGASFIVVYTGNVLTMPGLPKIPSAEKIDINSNNEIEGIF